MFFVFTAVSELKELSEAYTLLGVLDGRYYYISTDYLDTMLKRRGQLSSKPLLESELRNSEHGLLTTLDIWLGVGQKDILHLTVEDVEQFMTLFDMRNSEDLFLNLGEPQEDGSKSVGEIIFINSLAELIYRGRD